MSVYSSTVSFTCTFSEAVSLHRVERVLVPNFVSVSPMEGEHTVYTVTAGVVDNTLGTITLLLGEGAFATAQEQSPEYSVSVAYDFVYENVNVSAVVNTLSDRPDFAIITIAGGMTIRPTVQSVDEIAVFPASVEVLSVEATPISYVVKVFVKDPAALAQDTILIKPGVIQSYWGQKANLVKDVSITVLNTVTSTATVSLWPQSATVYTASQEFTYDVSSLPCPVDRQSFAGVNVEVLDVASGVLRARLVDDAIPGTLTFLGYKPDSCVAYDYPAQPSTTVVKETEPHYTLHFKTATAGCTDISVVFDAPVNVVGEELLSITPVSGLAPSVTSAAVKPVVPEFFLGIEATVCISTTSDTLLVSVNRDVVKTPSGAMLPEQEPTSIYVSQMSLVMNLLPTGLPTPSLNVTYVIRTAEFTMLFNTPSGINIGLCDYSKAFTSDHNVEIRTGMEGANLAVSVKSNSIDHHVIAFHADRVVCDGSFTVDHSPAVQVRVRSSVPAGRHHRDACEHVLLGRVRLHSPA